MQQPEVRVASRTIAVGKSNLDLVDIDSRNKENSAVPAVFKASKAKESSSSKKSTKSKKLQLDSSKEKDSLMSLERECEEAGSSSSKERRGKAFTRRLWNEREDSVILKLVKEYGTKKWTLISKKLQEVYHIYGRSGKQCRERCRCC
eukprot:TRINITY_DN5941_c0_g5_i1.p4 TRINITY_DN5941_c0_g5~~TRINITY_DN5941_c0_g5_i1.p4  ORF type:complete len:147 (-),score=44.31 TRINITY_DN5941_c0_g5_i1:1154-1594(-)